MNSFARVLYLALFLAVAAPAPAATLVVSTHGGETFRDIQSAIDAAADGDTVLVEAGEYVVHEPIEFNHLGGPVKNLVVRSAAGADATTVRMAELPMDATRATVFIFQRGETASSVLEGFTITGGQGTGTGATYGGGVTCREFSSPTLRELVVRHNAPTYGGALYCLRSSPTVIDCDLSENSVTCGGGAYLDASAPRFLRCTISGNRGYYASSGVHSKNGSAPVLTSCRLVGNKTYMGGAVDSFASSPTLINCVIAGNEAYQGGGAYADSGSLTLRNCTILANTATDGGAIFSRSDGVEVINSILWRNSPGTYSQWTRTACLTSDDPLLVDGGRFDVSRLKAVFFGGDWQELPDFVVEEPDCHLLSASPAIDAGVEPYAPRLDMDGLERPVGVGIDIGAHEYVPSLPVDFTRGDADGDGEVSDITDAVVMLTVNFLGDGDFPCRAACDLDGDGDTSGVTDAIILLTFKFLGGVEIPRPFPACGPAWFATDEQLGCGTPSPACF